MDSIKNVPNPKDKKEILSAKWIDSRCNQLYVFVIEDSVDFIKLKIVLLINYISIKYISITYIYMDDPFDSNKKDLIDFIDNETLDIILTNSDISKIYKLYYKNLSKILFDIYQKLHTIQKLMEEVTVYGLNIGKLYLFFMLSYSNNIKLTMFFSERAVLLYTEFIIMSRNPILNNDFKFTPSINDALQFVYKKTRFY